MLNIALLRRAQESILNRANLFSMQCWSICICGHILRAAGESEDWINRRAWERDSFALVNRATELMGVEPLVANSLFVCPASEDSDRVAAALKLERLIAGGSGLGSGLEPRLRSARPESTEAKEEEPELACV